jgi:hypothetical protein
MFVLQSEVEVCPKYLQDLEQWGGVRFSFSVLETLDRQTEAIGMYQKCGYIQ